MHIPASTDADADAASLPLRPVTHHLALSIYWLSNTLMWGVLLHIALQSRLQDWFGQTDVGNYIAMIGLFGGLLGAVAQILAGAFSDRSLSRWGRRRPFLLVGTLLAAPALYALGASKSFLPFLGAFILVESFANLAAGPFTALLPDTVNPCERGKCAGYMGIARQLGDAGGIILGGVFLTASKATLAQGDQAVAAFHDVRFFQLCILMGAFLLVTMLITLPIVKERPLRSRPQATTREVIREAFNFDVGGNKGFYWLSVSRAITNMGFYMFLIILLLFLEDTLGYAKGQAEAINAMIMLPAIGTAALISVPAGVLSDRIGRRRILTWGQCLMAFAAVGYALAPNLTVLYIIAVPAGIGYGIFTAVEWGLACNLLPPSASGRYLGVWNISAVAPQVLGFVVAGVVGSAVARYAPGMGWRVDFAIAAVCCLLGAYFLRHVPEHRGEASGAPPPVH
jgi:MFS family permease